MTYEEKSRMNISAYKFRIFLRIIAGMIEIKEDSKKIKITGFFLIFSIIIWRFRYHIWHADFMSKFEIFEMNINLIFVFTIISLIFLAVWGHAYKDYCMNKDFIRIGLVNNVGETPVLMKYSSKPNYIKIIFYSKGITLTEWKNNLEKIENTLDITISNISINGTSQRQIVVHGCKGKFDFDKPIYWEKSYQTKDSKIKIGESIGDAVVMDLSRTAHALIGGATGSGKSYLLKHILFQCINKGYKVYVADFKGGVDFSSIWKRKCKFVTEENETLKVLESICIELERRKKLLDSLECENIDQYNKYFEKKLVRIIFACDEVAELLDVKGLSKDEKEIYIKIEKQLRTIARLGRAFGIHLILATQRPDAEVINGQIKNNVTFRVFGIADAPLSIMVLGTSDASERIEQDSQGVFLTQKGILLKGYIFDEKDFNIS